MIALLRQSGEGPIRDLAQVSIELIRAAAAGVGHLSLKAVAVFSGDRSPEFDARHPFDPSPDHEYTPPPRIYG